MGARADKVVRQWSILTQCLIFFVKIEKGPLRYGPATTRNHDFSFREYKEIIVEVFINNFMYNKVEPKVNKWSSIGQS